MRAGPFNLLFTLNLDIWGFIVTKLAIILTYKQSWFMVTEGKSVLASILISHFQQKQMAPEHSQ